MCLLKLNPYLQKAFWLLKVLSEAKMDILIDYNFLILNNVISNGIIATMHNILQFDAVGFRSTVFP